jgi:hypothetical protein
MNATRRDFVLGVSASLLPLNALGDAVAPPTIAPPAEDHRLVPDQLARVCVVPQCLDNQWLPMRLLQRSAATGLGRAAFADELPRYVRSEYIRSLINAEQVVINRAFLKNNEVIYRDFAGAANPDDQQKDNRAAFRSLIESRVIVPFLLNETSPVSAEDFETSAAGAAGWRALCNDSPPSCLRLSWNNDTNRDLIAGHMTGAFQKFALALSDYAPDILSRLRALNGGFATAQETDDFAATARLVADFAAGQAQTNERSDPLRNFVTRDQLYRQFVVVAGTRVLDTQIDTHKPFASEIKLLFDLKYSLNLTDALNRHTLTPSDSPSRLVLAAYENAAVPATGNADAAADDLYRHLLAVRDAFALIEQELNYTAFDEFDLPTVVALRSTDEWHVDIEAVRKVLENADPLSAGGQDVPAIYRAYCALLARGAGLQKTRRGDTVKRSWRPTISIIIDIVGGGSICCMFGQQGGPARHRISTALDRRMTDEASAYVARIIVGETTGKRLEDELAASVITLRGKMRSPYRKFMALKQMIESDRRHFRADENFVSRNDPTVNHPLATL